MDVDGGALRSLLERIICIEHLKSRCEKYSNQKKGEAGDSRPSVSTHDDDADKIFTSYVCFSDGRYVVSNLKFCSGLRLDNLSIPASVVFKNCHFEERLYLRDVRTTFFAFENCLFSDGVIADRLRAESTFMMWSSYIIGGVRMCGAEVRGNLDFRGSKVVSEEYLAHFPDCVEQTLALATMPMVIKERNTCTYYAIHAGGTTVHGNVVCGVADAHIVSNRDADMLVVSDGIFESWGYIKLTGARVFGNVKINGGKLRGITASPLNIERLLCADKKGLRRYAFLADSILIEGNLDLRVSAGYPTEIYGGVRLFNAKINGDIDCLGTKLCAPGFHAFDAEGIEVKGAVFFQEEGGHKSIFNGVVCFIHATLEEGLYFRGVKIENDIENEVLNSQLYEEKNFGSLEFFFETDKKQHNNKFFSGVNAAHTNIGGAFEWSDVEFQQGGIRVSLENARVETLTIKGQREDSAYGFEGSKYRFVLFWISIISFYYCFSTGLFSYLFEWFGGFGSLLFLAAVVISVFYLYEKYASRLHPRVLGGDSFDGVWPKGRDVRIQMLQYNSLDRLHESNKWYATWLAESVKKVFTPQPFQQMEKVLEMHGHLGAARSVGMLREWRQYQKTKEDLRGANLPHIVYKFILGSTIGYGYQLWRLLLITFVWVWISTLTFSAACNNGQIVKTPTPDTAIQPGFNPLYYAMDTLVPAVDLGQVSYWVPNPSPSLNQKCDCAGQFDNPNILLRSVYGSATVGDYPVLFGGMAEVLGIWNPIFGWIFVTLAVVGVSRLVRGKS